jgi:NADH:ubiquinone oxidoreductase subunit D
MNARTDGLRHQGPENMESEHPAAHGMLRMILELNGEEFSGPTQYVVPYEFGLFHWN